MKIMAWYGDEWMETFEFVQCKPELSFLPMEVSLCVHMWRRREKLLIFIYSYWFKYSPS